MNKRTSLYAAASIVAFLNAGTSFAQSESRPDQSGQETVQESEQSIAGNVIVVTASRREQSIQSSPVAVAALTGDELQTRNIRNLEDLGISSPTLNVSLYQGEAQAYIRGIGTPIVIGGTDSSTAIHNDGVFLSRAAAAVPAFFDVERVEVIRGPQGTLYGRNATGGSINIISRAPSDTFEGEARVTVGNYDLYQVFGAVGGPIGDGSVRFRAAVQKRDRGGFTDLFRPDSDATGLRPVTDVEDADEFYARLRIDADLAPNVLLQLIGDYYRADDRGVTWHVFDLGYSQNGFSTNGAFTAATDAAAARGEFSQLRGRTMFSDVEFFNKPEIWSVTSRLDWELDKFTVTSLSSYRETNPFNRNDLDFSTANASDQLREEDHKQFSQEIQISTDLGGPLEFILGGFYFWESNDIRNEYFLGTVPDLLGFAPAPECCQLLLNGTAKTEAFAIFADGNFKLTDTLAVLFGGRYSRERRDGSNNVQLDQVPAFDNIAEFDAVTFDAFTPKIGLQYQPNADTQVYATATRGFKSGGFNIGSYQNEPFQPEFIWSYEVGGKFIMFDGRLQLNTAAFYYDYTDLQVQDTETNNVVIRNAASAEVLGFEIEGVAKPTDGLQFDFSVAYLDATFTNYLAPDPKYNNYLAALGVANPSAGNCPAGAVDAGVPNNPVCPFVQDLSGSRLPKAPEWKFTLGAQYAFDLGDAGSLTVRGDISWQDQIFFAAFQNAEPVAGSPALSVLEQGAYTWLRARATYESENRGWYVAAFIDNITDATVITNAIFTGDIVGSRAAGNLAPPRTFGLEAGVRF